MKRLKIKRNRNPEVGNLVARLLDVHNKLPRGMSLTGNGNPRLKQPKPSLLPTARNARVSMKSKTRACTKKAQMEMIGLVIIVILITLGILFMAQFALKETPTKKIFTRKGLATSTMSTIMKTTIINEQGCHFVDEAPQLEGRILEDCAANRNLDDSYFHYNCRGMNSCDFMEQFIAERFNETLNVWGKRYEFNSRLIQGSTPVDLIPPIYSARGGCPPTKDRDTSSPYPLNTPSGMVESILYICD